MVGADEALLWEYSDEITRLIDKGFDNIDIVDALAEKYEEFSICRGSQVSKRIAIVLVGVIREVHNGG